MIAASWSRSGCPDSAAGGNRASSARAKASFTTPVPWHRCAAGEHYAGNIQAFICMLHKWGVMTSSCSFNVSPAPRIAASLQGSSGNNVIFIGGSGRALTKSKPRHDARRRAKQPMLLLQGPLILTSFIPPTCTGPISLMREEQVKSRNTKVRREVWLKEKMCCL